MTNKNINGFEGTFSLSSMDLAELSEESLEILLANKADWEQDPKLILKALSSSF